MAIHYVDQATGERLRVATGLIDIDDMREQLHRPRKHDNDRSDQ